MKQPKTVTATQSELDELLALAKPSFPPAQYELLQSVLSTFLVVMLALQNAKTSIKRFRQMLFGTKTESKHKVLGDKSGTLAGDAALLGSCVIPASDTPADKPATPEPKARAGHTAPLCIGVLRLPGARH